MSRYAGAFFRGQGKGYGQGPRHTETGKGRFSGYDFDAGWDYFRGKGGGRGLYPGRFSGGKKYYGAKKRGKQFSDEENPDGPSEYFYEAHPELTKGQRVIKRHHPRCFGCILESDKIKNCKFCGLEFRKPENMPRSASPASSVKSGEDRNSKNQSSTELKIKKLVAKRLTETEAIQVLKHDFAIIYKAPKPKPKANEVIQTQQEFEKLQKQGASEDFIRCPICQAHTYFS